MYIYIKLLTASIFSLIFQWWNKNSPYISNWRWFLNDQNDSWFWLVPLVSFLHTVCLLPLLHHCLACSSLPFLTSFKLPMLFFFCTLGLSLLPFHPPLKLLFDPMILLFSFSLVSVFLHLTTLPPPPSTSPPAFFCLETSSLSSAAFLFTSIMVWLSFIPSVHPSCCMSSRPQTLVSVVSV